MIQKSGIMFLLLMAVVIKMCIRDSRLSATVDVYYDINSDILNQNIGGIIGTPIFAGGALRCV